MKRTLQLLNYLEVHVLHSIVDCPPEQVQCETDMSQDKNRKAVVQQTHKVKREVSPGILVGYTINAYPTRNRILKNGKDIDLFMRYSCRDT